MNSSDPQAWRPLGTPSGHRRGALPAPVARPSGAARARFRDAKAARSAQFLATRPTARAALRLMRGLSSDVDATLLELWSAAGMPADTALVAVGGYGRGELFPLLRRRRAGAAACRRPSAADDDARDSATERFITACWDSGLEIGSSVRTVDECVAMALADVTVQTAMLESRYLSGARKVFKAFEQATAGGDGSEGVPARQDARDAPAPPEVREHAVLARAQLQGKPGRAARPADRDLGRARRRPRPHLAGARRARPDHAVRGAPAAAQRAAC